MSPTGRIRGEEQPGFLDILSNWLPHQHWFPAPRSRRSLTRVGGLRLPTPEGDPDPGLFLELHIFEVELAEGAEESVARISVPVALRTRPSVLAGKSAFIGKLSLQDGAELWVYDGARDRAFLAAILEMSRRQQGTRNGRSRGEALADFNQWEPFTLQLRRQAVDSMLPNTTRTLVQPAAVDDSDWGRQVAVDFIRRPQVDPQELAEAVLRLTTAHSTTIPRVLGTVNGAWEERLPGADWVSAEWETGQLVIIREAGAEAPNSLNLARTALQGGRSFKSSARQLGQTLGNFHADLAGAFGAHPQSAEQLKAMAARAQQQLLDQWRRIREEFDEDEAADLNEVIDLMAMQLRDADEPLMLQRIHGRLTADRMHLLAPERWVVSEAGGFEEHALGLQDVISVLMSMANMVMEVASETPEIVQDPERSDEADQEADDSAESTPVPDPVNFGQWYEELSSQFLEGYRSSDADSGGVDSVFFRAAMLAEALDLFSRWQGQWVFRPSMLLQAEN
ncbi:maltokinase N-terminal cap-like domain-containing protein [Nesterenkonia alkaliphila]|uniref:Maltokinase n=1 Tax=Nesterenkonia alkaliphila TaxID=1463631 RepID=A0A7K1UMQ8_9MICC|nr:hypothetical protein [Nesterenkonia alkaliphila]MVT27758.1 hypothetical protein [Nesterenkonia alkaliphila]GFZ87399.1 hypothetical protein GCM10011359_15810 [Nesterenkonia alkaliphila]